MITRGMYSFLCKSGCHGINLFQCYNRTGVCWFWGNVRIKLKSRAFSTTISLTSILTPPEHTKMPEKNGSIEVEVKGYQAVQRSARKNGVTPDLVVDLRSDTLTQPSKGMREAIANARVGDDVFLEDPTTTEFETRVAKLLGKEAALFVTSGTQGNLICNLVHCNVRGSELICGNESHIFMYEQGNVSQFGGIHSSQIQNEPDGTFSIEKMKSKIRMDDVHYPITKVVCVENTHNRCGGRVLPLEWLDELAAVCKQNDIAIHMDGARLFNSVIASGVPASRIVRDMTSVTFCLSKGLGGPVGSCIAGSRNFIERARRIRKALGSGMRQSGILTSAGIYCLDNMIERLKEDHENARRITEVINGKGEKLVWIDPKQVHTNIIVLNVCPSLGCSILEFCERLDLVEDEKAERAAFGGKSVVVKCFPWSETAVRLVTYYGITKEQAEMGALKICYLAKKIAKTSPTAVTV